MRKVVPAPQTLPQQHHAHQRASLAVLRPCCARHASTAARTCTKQVGTQPYAHAVPEPHAAMAGGPYQPAVRTHSDSGKRFSTSQIQSTAPGRMPPLRCWQGQASSKARYSNTQPPVPNHRYPAATSNTLVDTAIPNINLAILLILNTTGGWGV